MDYCKTIEYRITPTKAYTIIRNCSGCGRKEHYVSTGNFRVNANGRQLDVWLVYQCEKCKHTYNLPIYERVSPEKIEDAQYQAFLGNDADTALQFGTDRNLFLKNRAEIDIERLECTIEKLNDDCAKHEGVENPEILEFKMIKLVLQPLVENAIYHGIKNKRGRGYLLVYGDFADEQK